MTPFEQLMAYQRETAALEQVAGRLGWDQETVMPRGAADQRAEEMAAMEGVLHARRVDPRVGDWLAAIEETSLDDTGRAQLRHIRRDHERATRVPARLSAEIARVTSKAQRVWAEARAKDDVAHFLPILEQVVALKREEGAALAAEGDVYDAMLQDYEPGMTGAALDELFGALRPRLVALREAVLAKPEPQGVSGTFDEGVQMRLSRKIAQVFGYDMKRGRVDKAVHPFSSGSGLDVRITTRTAPTDPFNCIYSTIHEVGHASYEQNVDPAYLLTPLGQGVSMGVHESQSRIYENQLGRSRAFTDYLFREMRDAYGELGLVDPEAFYVAVNRVQKGYIRTEADEVQYNLHILLRTDIERRLISRELEVNDLEEAWNARFLADFGYPVDRPSNGVLQDVHWSVGLFGYFPTYTLGNVYAGCLNEALRRDVPDLDARLAEGETAPATDWLRENLQRHGGLREPRDTIAAACGAEPSEGPLLDYLEAKFGSIYGL
ncbi:carboxypeptidase M32 [Histidinibacterium aquaticum]|uniref:Metal-dependent carboxypeptidase n=1 Tax=Histidinibacterium aquaticum TaxID=2613962 RepID=A0A5J5GLC3_9RHOB|nr:carboxypeptidase M32 [Histidinibacterium aquaticum]KAA9009089.1 carboxypeptidase M32 [Histidinibacterium aquaticum]